MKKLIRMLMFSAIALFLTSLYNKGFLIPHEASAFIKVAVLVALLYYLIVPLSKLLLLPFHILTLGLISVIVYIVLFYFIMTRWSLIEIQPWVFRGYKISYLGNLILSAVSISTVITILERLL